MLVSDGEPIDTTTAAGRLVFGIFAALAEFELIRERTVARAQRLRQPADGRAAGSSRCRKSRCGWPEHAKRWVVLVNGAELQLDLVETGAAAYGVDSSPRRCGRGQPVISLTAEQ